MTALRKSSFLKMLLSTYFKAFLQIRIFSLSIMKITNNNIKVLIYLYICLQIKTKNEAQRRTD